MPPSGRVSPPSSSMTARYSCAVKPWTSSVETTVMSSSFHVACGAMWDRRPEAPDDRLNKRKLLFADNAYLSLNRARAEHARLGPVTLLRELFRRFEEALDCGELVVLSPDGVDRKHRAGGSEVEKLDPARKLLDQRADDEADAAAFGDVAPHGRAGSVLVDLGIEAGHVASGDDRVVVSGRHLVRPQFQGLAAQPRQLDLLMVGEAMVLSNCDSHDLAS